jgi:hypothetical protein
MASTQAPLGIGDGDMVAPFDVAAFKAYLASLLLPSE